MINIFTYELPYTTLVFFFFVAFLIGMAKTGVHGIGMTAIPILAYFFGGKASAGLILPMLMMADVFGVTYYHRHASWRHLWKLFPWAAAGVIAGTFLGSHIEDDIFRAVMGVIIFVSLGIMIWMEKGKKDQIPDNRTFSTLMGFLGGFTSMVGNLAGSVMALYLLSVRLPKNEYIGTAAWFFMVVNFFKVPFHIFVWKTINVHSFLLDVTGLPFIALGAYSGIVIIKNIPDQYFRWFIILTTAVAAGVMLF